MAQPAQVKPFFLYYPLHLIHGPSEAPARFLSLFPERDLTATAASYGMCGVCQCKDQRMGQFGPADVTRGQCRTVLAMTAALDWAVGELVDGLMDNELYDSTIIVFTSDVSTNRLRAAVQTRPHQLLFPLRLPSFLFHFRTAHNQGRVAQMRRFADGRRSCTKAGSKCRDSCTVRCCPQQYRAPFIAGSFT